MYTSSVEGLGGPTQHVTGDSSGQSLALSPIRWLHLSDFHVGKDKYGQRMLFRYVLRHVRERVQAGAGPDMLFFTGDIANRGREAEYERFLDEFFFPLLDVIGAQCQERIFVVPGNHDVNRAQARAVRTYDVLLEVPEFLDPSEEGAFERSPILPRFSSFVSADCTTEAENHWLSSPAGAMVRTVRVRGQSLGVVGLNTAWLSSSELDRHKLSAGKGILEHALESVQDCDARIVLGHHPINWMLDTDLEPVKALLGKHNAIYLHGHLHRGHAGYEEAGGYAFLTLQSGACFQAREDEMWVNRILWCELDLDARHLLVESREWSRDYQEWRLDSSAFPESYRAPGTDRWVLPLPSRSTDPFSAYTLVQREPGRPEPPPGWLWVDGDFLAKRRVDLTPEQALSYFDGRIPIWREALSSQIPRRTIVQELVGEIASAQKRGALQITLLMGAAGEGKSTALMQTVCDLIESNDQWQVLWRNDPSSPLPAEFLVRLPETTMSWLVASDEADSVAKRVFEAVEALHGSRRRDVQFLMGCRDTDWIDVQADQLGWRRYATFVEKRLRGLQVEDARRIITAWGAYGQQGLGQLEGLAADEAVQRLVEAAQSEATRNRRDGAFLGAMLRVRWGAELKGHVHDLLKRLNERPIRGTLRTLLDAFAYIAALHAENIWILSKAVLAQVLGCHIDEVWRRVLRPLGEEAAIATTGRHIFTRHRAIAEASIEILSDSFGVDTDKLYEDLVKAALRASHSRYIPNHADWKFLSSRFAQKGDLNLAIRLAQAALDVDSDDSYLVVKLAQLLREAGQADRSVRILSETRTDRKHRGYYHEWGTSEGINGNRALSAWLTAVALADRTELRPPDNRQAKLSLNGLAITFAALHADYNMPAYLQACAASAQLGLELKLDSVTESFLRTNRARAASVPDVAPLEALRRVEQGVASAWRQREYELPDWVPAGNDLHLEGLARLLRIQTQRAQRLAGD